MAGRIRTIKPEWLDSESLLECSDSARLLSVSLILLSDDWGNLKASAKLIGAKVWPFHGQEAWAKASDALEELKAAGFVAEHNDGKCLFLTGWYQHQKVDRPGKPRHPLHPDAFDLMPPSWQEKYRAVAGKYELPPPPSRRKPPPEPDSRTVANIREDSRACHERSRLTIDHRPPTIDHEHRPASEASATGVAKARPSARVSGVPLKSKPDGVAKQVLEVFGAWRAYHPDQYLTPHPGLREWCEIERRLTQDSIPVDKLKRSVEGIHLDDWEGRPRNLTLLHAVRSPSAVERFVAMAQAPPGESEEERRAREMREREAKRKAVHEEARRIEQEILNAAGSG